MDCPKCEGEIPHKGWYLIGQTDDDGTIVCPHCSARLYLEHDCGEDGECYEWLWPCDEAAPRAYAHCGCDDA